MGKIPMPPRHLLTAEPHKAFLSLPKFTEQTVRKHFSSVVAQENAAEEFATDEDEFEGASSPETPGRCKKRMKVRKYYQLHEMEIFEDLRLIHEGKTLNAICELAKAQLPSIFLPRTKYETFKRFPAMIAREAAKKKAFEDAKEAQRKAGIERKLNHDIEKDDEVSITERKKLVASLFLPEKNPLEARGGPNNQVVPSTIFVGLAMLLWSQYLAGVPLTCSLALPMVVGYFRANGVSHLLHSMQTSVPLLISLKAAGFAHEPGKVFWTKRLLNRFFLKIGLSMRKGTCNHGKSKKPAEVDGLRKLLGLRLLWVMVKKCVPRGLIFQLDETGVDLLPLHNYGRAAQGSKEVNFHGIDEKRQFTLTPVIDGDGELLKPTQTIWGGQEFKTIPDPADPKGRRRIPTSEFASGACPSQAVQDQFSETLVHVQTESHWCTFGSFIRLITSIATHAMQKMHALGLDVTDQHWIIVMDVYSVHISEAFIKLANARWPHLIFIFIPAGCTGWMQPLDLAFNLPFKQELKQAAGMWLSSMIQEQLKTCEDPADCKLDIRLSTLKPLFCSWLHYALTAMESKQDVLIKKGWNESGMGMAMDLAQLETGEFDEESSEFQEAEILQAKGLLFEKFTDKTAAAKTEQILAARFTDLFDADEDTNQGVKPDEPEPALHATSQEGLFSSLCQQGRDHQAAMRSASLLVTPPEDPHARDIRGMFNGPQ